MDDRQLDELMDDLRRECSPTANNRRKVDRLLAASLGFAATGVATESAAQTLLNSGSGLPGSGVGVTGSEAGTAASAWWAGPSGKWLLALAFVGAGGGAWLVSQGESDHSTAPLRGASTSTQTTQPLAKDERVSRPVGHDTAQLPEADSAAFAAGELALNVEHPTAPTLPDESPALKRRQSRDASKESALAASPSVPSAPVNIERAPTTPSAPVSVGEELLLISKADRALREGDLSQAQSLLAQHQRRFPSGQLRQERRGLLALLRCMSGAGAGAFDAAQRFIHSYPHSPLSTRLESTCKK